MNYRIINIVGDAQLEPYVGQLVTLGRLFYRETTLADKGLEADTYSLLTTVKTIIDSPNGIFILALTDTRQVVGAIAGLITPWMLCMDQRMAMESWWYVAQACRGEHIDEWLLQQFEDTAKAKGAAFCVMGTHDHPRERVLLHYYHKKGYVSLEHLLIKRV